jgi:predicted DNA-binding protein
MSLETCIGVRFLPETKGRLRQISQASGLTVGDLIRRATEEWLDEAESTGRISINLKVAEPRAEYTVDSSKKKGKNG